jgi:hypothetical protein
MKTVFRYKLAITDEPGLFLPSGAEVLSVGPPRDGSYQLDLWAQVDILPDAEKELREFRVIGTGNPMPSDCGRFIGTVPTHEGAFIWHVFEKGNT